MKAIAALGFLIELEEVFPMAKNFQPLGRRGFLQIKASSFEETGNCCYNHFILSLGVTCQGQSGKALESANYCIFIIS